MTLPRKARPSDYSALIAFLNIIFQKRMDLEYCHIYKPTRKDMANNIIVLEGGHIAGCVGIFPMTFVCGDVRLSVAGIGGVSTEPQCRGQGIMTKLLTRAVSMMHGQNYDISILWGDRLRYNHFGWENAGGQYVFNIDRRHATHEKRRRGQIRPLSHSSDDLRRIARLYNEWELRVHRTPEQLRSVFSRHTYDTWVWREGGDFAYVTARKQSKEGELIEFGGVLEGLDELLSFLFGEYELENLRGTVGLSRSPYLPFITSRCSEWGIRFIGMVKILNLRSVLQKFVGQIEKKCRDLGLNGSLTLEMTDSGQFATLHFGSGVAVSDRKSEQVLRLSDTEMVRLVFGTIPPSHSLNLDEPLGYLDAIFPLDFYVPRLDYV